MPLTRLSVPKQISLEKIKALASGVQDALVETCNVPPTDLFQVLMRFDPEKIILDPTFGGAARSPDACIGEITFLQGRADDQKCRLFSKINAHAVEAGLCADEVMIALTVNSRMDWALGRGMGYADHVTSAKSNGA